MTANQNIDINVYHTLLVKENDTWSPAFGDYDLDVVEQEAKDSHADDKTRVISTGPDQEDINLVVACLNKQLDDMVEKVKTVLLQGEMPDQDFINKRQADRDAVEAQDKADQAEWDRVALIKENAEELVDVLEELMGLVHHKLSGKVERRAWAVIKKARVSK
jgi:hypothetical protein